MIRFKAKIWKQGRSIVITIPAHLIKGLNKEIDLELGDDVLVEVEKV